MNAFRKHVKIFGNSKPVQPNQLPEEKECHACIYFVENVDSKNKLGWCSLHQEPTMNYDECGGFDRNINPPTPSNPINFTNSTKG